MSNYYVLTILHLGNLIQFMKLQPRICEKKKLSFQQSSKSIAHFIRNTKVRLSYNSISFTKAVPVPSFFLSDS